MTRVIAVVPSVKNFQEDQLNTLDLHMVQLMPLPLYHLRQMDHQCQHAMWVGCC